MAAKELTDQAQGHLALVRPARRAEIPIELVHAQRTFKAALALAVQSSGLDAKEIYIPLGVDAGHWSRIVNGDAHFQLDKVRDFCELVGNTVLPEWIAYQVGRQTVMIEGEAERLLRLERDARARNELAEQILNEQISEVRHAAASIPPGEPGICERCGRESARLVMGASAPCRDKYKLP